MDFVNPDPFTSCESNVCNHELTKGVLVADLLCCDGPYPLRRPGHEADWRINAPNPGLPDAA